MTSKEMEARSGVARANIRYYEAEGLLTPARMKNGYRDYSEEDLALLEKIKLLRRLGVSVQELKELRAGQAELSAVLDRRLAELQGERLSQQRVETVCGALRRSGETFSTLNAPKYLSDLDAPSLPPSQSGSWWAQTPAAPLPAADILPPAPGLIIRFFARLFDNFLATCLLFSFFALLGQNPSLQNTTLMGILLEVALLVVEPLLIHLLGATPGKALLGLRLAQPDGSRLSYGEAVTRHLRMLWHAMGFGIPILSLVQAVRCVLRAYREEPQPWDEEIAYTAKPFHSWRGVLLFLAGAAVLAGAEAVNSYATLPPNRGDLTVAEFAENYNRQARYLGAEGRYELDEEGNWRPLPDAAGNLVMPATDWQRSSPFRYTVEDGRLTAVSLTVSYRNQEGLAALPVDTWIVAATAFVWAREDAPFLAPARQDLLEDLANRWPQDGSWWEAGVILDFQIEQEHFEVFSSDMGLIFPEDGAAENFFSCTFTMSLEE